MTISKKQFDFTVRGRVMAIDSTAALAPANLQAILDAVSIAGVEYDLTTPATAGVGAEAFTYPTIVADTVTPAQTATLAATTTAIKAIVLALKNIT